MEAKKKSTPKADWAEEIMTRNGVPVIITLSSLAWAALTWGAADLLIKRPSMQDVAAIEEVQKSP